MRSFSLQEDAQETWSIETAFIIMLAILQFGLYAEIVLTI